MEKRKDVTIYDIAKKLQLSPATISRALNDHPGISERTKKRILDTANELGYRSNTFASNLRRQHSNTLGVIVPRLNSYFMSMAISGMEKVANQFGYNLLISQSLETMAKEIKNAQTMYDSRVDGLLVSLAYDTRDLSHFDAFTKRGIPLIFFDRVADQQKVTSVVINNYRSGYEVTSHLVSQGCRHIAHITGNVLRNVYADRLKGYKQALSDNGLPFCKEYLMETDLSEQAGIESAKKLLKMDAQPDGIFVANDTCAISCIRYLQQAAVNIPADIAVAGFNNNPISRVIEPALTTVNYPAREMGEVTVTNLINHLNGSSNIHATNTIILRSDLIVRDSTLRKMKIDTAD
ncbi:MAG TPA: LacI family DNA-binding transcriptional regulator [Balneolales bacterium]|nr:LacI family DNA-binding transcriptional regulator [Balneolales bacterium]